MSRMYLSIAGAITGCAVSARFLNRFDLVFFQVLVVGLPLVLGSVGYIVGMMLDARKVHWKGVFGIFGMPIGLIVGYELARRMAPPSGVAGSEAITGIVFGAPSGAILGFALGLAVGAGFDKWLNKPEPTQDVGNG